MTYPTRQEIYDFAWGDNAYGYRLMRYRDGVGGDTTYEHKGVADAVTAINATYLSQTRRTEFVWDAKGNLTDVKMPTASGAILTASATYDPTWNVPTWTRDVLGIVTTVDLDAMTGAPLTIHGPEGDTKLWYNTFGDLERMQDPISRVSRWEYTNRGEVLRATSPERHTTTFGYDDASRLTALRLPGPFDYGIAPDVLLSSQGNAWYYLYNDMDQVTDVGNMPDPTDIWIPEYNYFGSHYDYDNEGNLARVTLPGNQTYEWAYDAMDRVRLARDPWKKESSLTYTNGRVSQVVDRAGNRASYSYYSDGRPSNTSVVTKQGASVSNVTYQYDTLAATWRHMGVYLSDR